MTDASVLIPYRRDGGLRDQHLAWVCGRWSVRYPVHVGYHPHGMWNKAKAVAQALTYVNSDVIIVADADVWMPDFSWVEQGVHLVGEQGRWSMPHHYVHRLTLEATRTFKADPTQDYRRLPHDRQGYGGVPGGGLFIVRRSDYLTYGGLDPAFEGHTGEDEALGYLLTTLAGPPFRGRGDLVHLYHPEQPTKRDAAVRRKNNARLEKYRHARGRRGLMMRLADQISVQMLDQPATPPS